MPQPFTSRTFFTDPFFTRPTSADTGYAAVTRTDGTTGSVPVIYRNGLDPKRDGELIQRGGHWIDASVRVADYRLAFGATTKPEAHEAWAIGGLSFSVESQSMDGDVFNVKALNNQRKNR